MILELERESKNPLILGFPFLSTSGAIIDIPKGKINLHLGNFVINFDMNQALKQPTLD